MDVPRVLLITLLLIFVCSTASALKNDRGEPSFGNGPNFLRRNRRIVLNEYLVPPPPPRHHPLRSGRMANPQATEAPGYFSKFMNWINPFNYGGSHSSPPKSPPYPDAPFPPPPQPHGLPLHPHGLPPQPHGLPLNVHPPGPPNLPLPPPGQQPPLPLYPPLGHPPNQHPGVLFTPPVPPHPIAPPNAPPSPSLPIYGAPPPTLHTAKQYLPPPNKGKACNPCNKVPWLPMQGGGFPSQNQYLPPQLSNGYLPPSNQGNHDTQHAASHEIRIPDLPPVQIEQNGPQGLAPNPLLYPGPVPPLYQAGSFDRPPQNSHTDVVDHLEPPSLPIAPPINQEHKHPEVAGDHFNIHGNHDLTSSGTHVDQGHASVVPQNHGIEVSKGPTDHEGSFGSSIFDSQPPISGSSGQEYDDPSAPKQEHGLPNQSVHSGQGAISSYGSSGIENHGFTSQNGDVYHESFASNSGQSDLNYLPPNLGPSASYGATSNNRDVESLNYQYSDLSPSSSIVKDSRATTEAAPTSSSSIKEDSVHFEESPLLDLTKKSESRNEAQWPLPTAKTTTNNNLQIDNVFFEDSSVFAKSTESYSSNAQSVNGIFGPSTPTTGDFLGNGDHRYTETSTVSTQYTNQQDVSYIPPSGQPGFLWPSLLLNNPTLKNESSNGDAFLNPLARWNNSSKEVNYKQQGRPDSTDVNDSPPRQQNVKRNKQVQVIIPYTSEYTPIPFQQTYGDWSVRNNLERTQARKIPSSSNKDVDNYLQQESRNEIRLINQLQPQFAFNDSKKLNIQSNNPSLTPIHNDSRSTPVKANNSIDVRRLQKNIDNWTIQEYSRPTTSSTILPSSPHPYLQPSKKIPTEYLTTTETGDYANESNDNIESVKTYSLAGFSFNEVEHEGSASNHIEVTQTPINVIRIESSKSVSSFSDFSASTSSVDKERVFVVTPQPTPATSPKNDFEKQKREKDRGGKTNKSTGRDEQRGENEFSQFEAIEKAYQVLPQAVNNLAVASTGKEDVPLWGIMEHEEFAALNADETDDEPSEDVVDGPVLYSGHSKVSRAKR